MTPLSRRDLPRIIESVDQLYRIIEHPPAKPWPQAPTWLVEQYSNTTCGVAGLERILSETNPPPHPWLIDAAATEVLYRLAPPFGHTDDTCPATTEITASSLDRRHKVALIELRNWLTSSAFFGGTLAYDDARALLACTFLGTVLEQLGADRTSDQDETEKSEGGTPPAGRVGRLPLTASKKPEDKAKLNVYELIRTAKDANSSWGKKELHKHFKNQKDFNQLVKDAKLSYNPQMFHSALEWIKANPIVGQETQSGNVS